MRIVVRTEELHCTNCGSTKVNYYLRTRKSGDGNIEYFLVGIRCANCKWKKAFYPPISPKIYSGSVANLSKKVVEAGIRRVLENPEI